MTGEFYFFILSLRLFIRQEFQTGGCAILISHFWKDSWGVRPYFSTKSLATRKPATYNERRSLWALKLMMNWTLRMIFSFVGFWRRRKICTFDEFNRGRHVYTFENRCIEDPTLGLDDGSHKIFLCAKGTEDDCSEKMKEMDH